MPSRKFTRVLLAVAAFVAVAVGVRSCHMENQWEDRVRAVQDSVAAARLQIDDLSRAANEAQARADLLAEEAAALTARADATAEAAAAAVRDVPERIIRTRLETPADLEGHPAVVARDSIIDDLYQSNAQWEEGYGVLREANIRLVASNVELTLATDSLRSALTVATASITSLNAVLDARPGGSPWWVPEIGIGPSVGLETDGTAYAGVGLNLNWSIPF